MTKYDANELMMILNQSNLSVSKLAKILDISAYRAAKYLLQGEKIKPEEMMKLDSAIKVLRETGMKQPIWNVQDWWYGIEWSDVVGIWNDHLKELTRQEVQHLDECACDDILFVIGLGNVSEYSTTYDPLKNCGLEKYSVDEFKKRIMERVKSYE